MSSLTRILNKADREVVDQVRRLHVGAQAYRFMRVALFAFLASLPVTIGSGKVGWGVLASLGAGALETAFRQQFPAFPLDKTTGVVVRAVKEQATQLATAAINAQVEDYKASLASQAAVTSMLAQARTVLAAGVPVVADHPAPAEVPSLDAKPPAVSA